MNVKENGSITRRTKGQGIINANPISNSPVVLASAGANSRPLKETTNITKPLGLAQKKLCLKSSKKPVSRVSRPPPQVAKTALYDEHWAAKQERGRCHWQELVPIPSFSIGFVRWLNHMLVPMKSGVHSSIEQKGADCTCYELLFMGSVYRITGNGSA